ncbi:sulfurtransferase TusA family protein [Motilimonas cestriensis]|uniref:Sulfurtransferase TusA family protein n=1 Tax=Motilimonas cestriensis TaxID=2742685 RepID=A0ABS8W545_9GAMM|nr:sulfurtransferase TusA family protein [Motilimonas cestriensis]MCE2593415.1 sulfurtransferase TusA family protein [Motilimonas cestriensis]
MTTLDCRDLSCPMPLINMRQWLAKAHPPAQLTLLVSDPGSKQDVPRYLIKHGIQFEREELPSAVLSLIIFLA